VGSPKADVIADTVAVKAFGVIAGDIAVDMPDAIAGAGEVLATSVLYLWP